jgi:hypothetical protein
MYLVGYSPYAAMPPKSLEETFQELHDDTTIEFLMEDAKRRGIPWHKYCYKYGIVGKAQNRRIKRHEVTTGLGKRDYGN